MLMLAVVLYAGYYALFVDRIQARFILLMVFAALMGSAAKSL
jgi:hypothetical protein